MIVYNLTLNAIHTDIYICLFTICTQMAMFTTYTQITMYDTVVTGADEIIKKIGKGFAATVDS